MVDADAVRRVGLALPRTYEAFIGGRWKLKVRQRSLDRGGIRGGKTHSDSPAIKSMEREAGSGGHGRFGRTKPDS